MKISQRYYLEAKQAFSFASIAALSALLCGAYAGVAHADRNAIGMAALAVGLLLALFITVSQIHEAAKCLRLFRQWQREESASIPQPHFTP